MLRHVKIRTRAVYNIKIRFNNYVIVDLGAKTYTTWKIFERSEAIQTDIAELDVHETVPAASLNMNHYLGKKNMLAESDVARLQSGHFFFSFSRDAVHPEKIFNFADCTPPRA